MPTFMDSTSAVGLKPTRLKTNVVVFPVSYASYCKVIRSLSAAVICMYLLEQAASAMKDIGLFIHVQNISPPVFLFDFPHLFSLLSLTSP